MGTSRKLSLFFNFLFLLILFIFSMYLVFRFTEPFYSKIFDNSRRVKEDIVISELQESINRYYEYIYFGQFEKAKHSTSIISRRSNIDYERKQEEIAKFGEFEVVVKYAYRLYGDTYRCYIVLHDKTSEDTSYIVDNNKKDMVQIVVSLDRMTNNFTIVTDSSFESRYIEEGEYV